MPSTVYNFCAVLTWPLLRGLYRLDDAGVERIPPEGGFVLAANHVSNFDPFPLAMPLWPRRQLYYMAKVELFKPPLAQVLKAGGAFPVRRGERDLEAFRSAVEICRRGDIVAMFPEGTRRSKGLRKRFQPRPRSGSARIAFEAGVPLVPAAIKGTDRLARLEKLRVAYGDPIPVDDLVDHPGRAGLPGGDRAADGADRRALRVLMSVGRPLLVVDGDSLAHRAYHALPKSMRSATGLPSGAIVGFANFLLRLWQSEEPRAVLVGWDCVGRAHLSQRGVPRLPGGPRLRSRAARAARPPAGARPCAGLRGREAARIRGGRLPRRRGRPGGAARRDLSRRHLRPRLVPARQRADDRAPAGEGRLRARADRAGRGSRALRRRTRAGAGLHRAARRSLRQAPRRARRRPEDRGLDPRRVRDAGSRARGGKILGGSGGLAPLPANGHD